MAVRLPPPSPAPWGEVMYNGLSMGAGTLVLFMGLLLGAAVLRADPHLAIVEKKAGEVGFYSSDGKRLAGVKVGQYPHEIVLSPDRRFAYVSDNGVLWMTNPGQGGNTISIIDLAARKRVGVIELGEYRRPHGMDIHGPTNRMVCTIENPDGMLLIDLTARKVVRKYDVQGTSPHMVIFDPGGEWAYVSNTGTHTLAAVHLATGEVKLIPTDERPQGAVFAADKRTLYLTNSDGHSISIIDATKKERVGAIRTGQGPGRIAITPDQKTLVYNLQAGQAVGFADIAARKEVARIDLGGNPLSLTMSGDGRHAYAGVQDQDKVFVISVPERKIVRVFQTPKDSGPDPVLPLP